MVSNIATSFLFGKFITNSESFIMETTQEAVDIRLRVPVFITFTRVAEITVVSQFFQILIFDVQLLHQRLVVIKTMPTFMSERRQFLLFHYYAENLFKQFPVA